MYNTDNHQDGYCLLSNYVHDDIATNNKEDDVDEVLVRIYQAISYCLRPSEGAIDWEDFGFENTAEPTFTFAELKEQNISSHMLLSWSAPIDLAERYQRFLDHNSNSSIEKEVFFHKCTTSWFGPFCHFTFDFEMDKSFNDIVAFIFQSKKEKVRTGATVTCYKHLNCQTLLPCLDWREICDGKSDCLDGSDEDSCWQLEVSECADNEYRCHHGQCIPTEFLRDDSRHPDCLDRTDERPESYSIKRCPQNPGFHCEEHRCRPGPKEFPCGDGECTDGIERCFNGRTSLLPGDVIPRLFGHVDFIYSNSNEHYDFSLPDYVCYDEKLCADFLPATEPFDNLTCRRINDVGLGDLISYYDVASFVVGVKDQFRACLIVTNETHFCNYTTMYRCEHSTKCISKQRLLDGIRDCPWNDDETFTQSCSLSDARQRFKCSGNDHEKCFASLVIRDGQKNCQYTGEDERTKKRELIETHIYFQTICDEKRELSPVLIDGKYETDETECGHWPCNNTYTRCDGFWFCKNGSDEVNCPPSTCPEHHHDCVFPNDTSKISCLPIAQAGDGVNHCLGGTDEREADQGYLQTAYVKYNFHCWSEDKSINVVQLCDNATDYRMNDDETFCTNFVTEAHNLCSNSERLTTAVEKFFCSLGERVDRPPMVHLKLSSMPSYPLQLKTNNASFSPSTLTKIDSTEENIVIDLPYNPSWWCNRGVPIRPRANDNTFNLYCLCPPSYYGDRCQYQNQRVSLTLQIRATSDWRSVFIFSIILMDNERNIQSHDHIEYSPIRDCAAKFNIYLLYSTRPKNSSKTYSVQIDAFNQWTLNYRASWIFPLRFGFLPVHRLSVLLKVPFSNVEPFRQICRPSCIHGQCLHYTNDQSSTFCRCEPGWSGVQCDVEHKCDCASGSLCVSKSICLCPPGQFGSRCHLFQLSCHTKSCMNGGECVPMDVRHVSTYSDESMCICPEGYEGDRCEKQKKQTRIDISFHPDLIISSSLLVHFIRVQKLKEHVRTSVMKKIGFDQDALTFHTSHSFNIAFAQMFSHYYLIILQEKTIISAQISTEVIPSHRCRSIDEVFNKTFSTQHLLKRIKYYHIPCQQQRQLVCFYDNVQFCLCTLDRQVNCFEFDRNMTYNCGGYNFCENDGHCFQDDAKCPTSSFCVCRQCYFGSRCQFSTKGSTLSLDTILGYHIHLKTKMNQQTIIVKVAIAFTTIMFVVGSINSFFSFQTFRGEATLQTGCGLYLFTSSIVSMIIVIIFTLKFSLYLLWQSGSIKNRSFIHIQCVSIDFLIRSLLSTSDWLSACVAVERVVIVLQILTFNKAMSKKVAKWSIVIVLLFTTCTYIYDPFHRHLTNDEEEQRTWCVSKYSSSLKGVDRILNIFHFSIPFSINIMSALAVIIILARSHSKCQQRKSFKEYLCKEIQNHKHLLISPCILVLIALPRLVISFLSGCMESARDSWLYLIGYFISFIPSMMTFIIFVLPSPLFKKEFVESMKRIRLR